MSAAVSSTSSNTADQRTFASWFAPTAVSVAASTKTRSDGVLGRRESAGTRTSKPASCSCGPVAAIRSHASSPLRITWPRRVPPGRPQRGQHALEAADLVFEVLAFGTAGDDRLLDRDRLALRPRARTPRGATRRRRRADRAARSSRACSPVTERAQRSRRVDDLARRCSRVRRTRCRRAGRGTPRRRRDRCGRRAAAREPRAGARCRGRSRRPCR